MATKVTFLNSTLSQWGEEEFNSPFTLMFNEGVLFTRGSIFGTDGDLHVEERSAGANMTVDVLTGKAMVETTRGGVTFNVLAENKALANLTVPANVSGSNRIDAVILRVDRDANPNALMTNIVTLEYITNATGTPTSAMSDGDIQTALGDSDDFIRLANITVANGAASILNASIADTRTQSTMRDAGLYSSKIPTGAIMPYGGSSAPSNYLMCDGSLVSRTTYAALYAVIGESFGSGDGSTTFAVPDMRLKLPLGILPTNKTVVEDCEDAWNELVAANVTSNLDNIDYKVGTGSIKLTVGSAVTAGTILATEVISSTPVTGRTHIHAWIKSSVTTASGDLQLLLDDTANCASASYTMNIPALVAGVWKRVSMPITHIVGDDVSAISIGLKMVVDLGTFTLNVDDICFGNGFEMGITSGEENHTLNQSEMPAHTHPPLAPASYYVAGGNNGAVGTDSSNDQTQITTTGSRGGGLAHNVMPPVVGVNYIIKT